MVIIIEIKTLQVSSGLSELDKTAESLEWKAKWKTQSQTDLSNSILSRLVSTILPNRKWP